MSPRSVEVGDTIAFKHPVWGPVQAKVTSAPNRYGWLLAEIDPISIGRPRVAGQAVVARLHRSEIETGVVERDDRVLHFSDGVEIPTGGPLRVYRGPDGLYVVGEGMMEPVADEDEAREVIARRRAIRDPERKGE